MSSTEDQTEVIEVAESDGAGLKSAATDQTSELNTAKVSQEVVITVDDQAYCVKWDGTYLRLLQPLSVDLQNAVVSYKILGHVEMGDKLPVSMDPETLQRQAMVVIASYKDQDEVNEGS